MSNTSDPVSPKSAAVKPDIETSAYDKTHQGNDASNGVDMAYMGYQQEVKRNLSMVTAMGLGLSIIAPAFGLSTSAAFSLTNGGPTSYVWGWFFLSVISLCIAASLGEICSVYPSSGGVYLWTAHLTPRKYSALASFVVGWISVVANLLLCLSIAFGEAQLIAAGISVFRNNEWTPKPWEVILLFWAVMVICAFINAWGVKGRLLEPLNTLSIYWTAATVIIIAVTVLVMSDDRRTGAEVFAQWQNTSGWVNGWSWFVGLLTPAYVLTGYGTICYLCDEVSNPSVSVPKAMLGSVIAASIAGFLFVIPIGFVLPEDMTDILASAAGQPIPSLFYLVTGTSGGAFGLLFTILGVGMFASIGSLTVASRSIWSFSRDRGLPLHRYWSRVDKYHEMPLLALILSTVIISVIGVIYQGAAAAFNAFTGSATILLGVSYIIPVSMSLLEGRQKVKNAPWSLGRFGYVINIIALIWVIFSCILFCFPTTKQVTSSTMNYASVIFVFFGLFASLYYALYARKDYEGPTLDLTEPEEVVQKVE